MRAMTTTQARRAMGGRAELESHLPLLELAGKEPARSSCSSEEMCYHRSLNWAGGEEVAARGPLTPHTRGPAWSIASDKQSRRTPATSIATTYPLTCTH